MHLEEHESFAALEQEFDLRQPLSIPRCHAAVAAPEVGTGRAVQNEAQGGVLDLGYVRFDVFYQGVAGRVQQWFEDALPGIWPKEKQDHDDGWGRCISWLRGALSMAAAAGIEPVCEDLQFLLAIARVRQQTRGAL